MDTLNSWFERDQDRADFRVVYIREAHPSDGWQVPANEKDGVILKQPVTMEERTAAARQLRDELGLKLPIIVDGMDDGLSRAYSGWPDRLFIIDKEGKVAYSGEQGPRGFRPDLAQMALDRLVGG